MFTVSPEFDNLFHATLMVAKPSLPRSFRNWTIDTVYDFKPLKVVDTHPVLNDWLQSTVVFSPDEQAFLRRYQSLLLKKVAIWSEEDLKMKFIAHVLAAADIDDNEIGYRTFFETTMKGSIDGQTLTACLDMVVAMGIAEPRRPFFFSCRNTSANAAETTTRLHRCWQQCSWRRR
jgi:hypothetical protein